MSLPKLENLRIILTQNSVQPIPPIEMQNLKRFEVEYYDLAKTFNFVNFCDIIDKMPALLNLIIGGFEDYSSFTSLPFLEKR